MPGCGKPEPWGQGMAARTCCLERVFPPSPIVFLFTCCSGPPLAVWSLTPGLAVSCLVHLDFVEQFFCIPCGPGHGLCYSWDPHYQPPGSGNIRRGWWLGVSGSKSVLSSVNWKHPDVKGCLLGDLVLWEQEEEPPGAVRFISLIARVPGPRKSVVCKNLRLGWLCGE